MPPAPIRAVISYGPSRVPESSATGKCRNYRGYRDSADYSSNTPQWRRTQGRQLLATGTSHYLSNRWPAIHVGGVKPNSASRGPAVGCCSRTAGYIRDTCCQRSGDISSFATTPRPAAIRRTGSSRGPPYLAAPLSTTYPGRSRRVDRRPDADRRTDDRVAARSWCSTTGAEAPRETNFLLSCRTQP